MKKLTLALAALLAAVTLAYLAEARGRDADHVTYDRLLRERMDSTRAAYERAERERQRADSAIAAAAVEAERATAAEHRADSAQAVARLLRARLDSMPVPDAALAYTAPRDSLIAALTTEAGGLRDALAAERRAHAATATAHERLSVAYTMLSAANDSLLTLLYRRPDPDTRWRVPVLGVRVPTVVEGGVRCAVPAGIAWLAEDSPVLGIVVGAACVLVR